MPAADPDAPVGAATQVEVCAAARASVREVVAAGGASGRPGRRWVVPLAAAAAVAAAACAPVAWPLLAGAGAADGARPVRVREVLARDRRGACTAER